MKAKTIFEERITIGETELKVSSDLMVPELSNYIISLRSLLKRYIMKNPEFLTSFEPLTVKETLDNNLSHDHGHKSEVPLIVNLMSRAGRRADVGPMAAVAGTISQLSMGFMAEKSANYIIIDNGGDISLEINKDVVVGLYAGESSLSGELGFKIKPKQTPMGICTSSGTVGHSISFGRADSVTVFANEASIADALATSIANEAKGTLDEDAVQRSLEHAEEFKKSMRGVMVVVGESAGTLGRIPQLVQTDKKVVLGDLFEV
jgi:ApbE superfamily uncharacterized protein (UPF0280 family)